MDIFGANFTIALGAWKLRFVLMLEDSEDVVPVQPPAAVPHHLKARSRWGATVQ
jgi:hypothetical protein